MRNITLTGPALVLIAALVTVVVALRPDLGAALTAGATVLAGLAALLAAISGKSGGSTDSVEQRRD